MASPRRHFDHAALLELQKGGGVLRAELVLCRCAGATAADVSTDVSASAAASSCSSSAATTASAAAAVAVEWPGRTDPKVLGGGGQVLRVATAGRRVAHVMGGGGGGGRGGAAAAHPLAARRAVAMMRLLVLQLLQLLLLVLHLLLQLLLLLLQLLLLLLQLLRRRKLRQVRRRPRLPSLLRREVHHGRVVQRWALAHRRHRRSLARRLFTATTTTATATTLALVEPCARAVERPGTVHAAPATHADPVTRAARGTRGTCGTLLARRLATERGARTQQRVHQPVRAVGRAAGVERAQLHVALLRVHRGVARRRARAAHLVEQSRRLRTRVLNRAVLALCVLW